MKFQLFIIVLLSLLPTLAQSQTDTKDENERIDEIAKLVRKEIKVVYKPQLELQLREFRKHFQLTKPQLKKLDELVESAAQAYMDGCQDRQIKSAIRHSVENLNALRNIKINETLYHLDDSDKTSTPTIIRVSGQTNGIWLSSSQGGSMISTLDDFDVRDSEMLQRTIPQLTDEQLNEFYLIHDQQFQARVLEMIVITLSAELLLTEDQIPKIREWFQDDVKPYKAFNRTLYSTARRIIRQADKEKPAFLTNEQFESFQRVKGSTRRR